MNSPGSHLGAAPGPNWTPSATEPVPVVPDHQVFPEPIGSGSYGVVFLARNVMGTWRAVKAIYRARFESDRSYEREFDGVRRFEPVSRSHPSQLNVLQVGQDGESRYFYYAMELADNAADPVASATGATAGLDPESYRPRSLASELKQHGRLPFAECLQIGLGLATALDHLHRRDLVHRDVKPANIVFVNGIPKLADIGLVTATGARTFVGTEGYVAPEGPGTPAADVFSLGRVLYEMATGRDRTDFPQLPAGFETFEEHDQLLELNQVILKAGALDLAERYPSAAALHSELVLVQAGRSIERQRRLERALRLARVAALVVALLGLTAWIGATIRSERKIRARELVREAQTIRLMPRRNGWSSNSLEKLRQAGRLARDNDARDQAAAAFTGLDARRLDILPKAVGTAVVFDQSGGRLAITGGSDWQGNYVPSRIRDLASGRTETIEGSQSALLSFGANGRVEECAWETNGVLMLRAPAERRVVTTFDPPPFREGTHAMPRSLARSPDGAWVAAAGEGPTGPTLALWRVADGRLTGTIKLPATAIAFSPDSTVLAAGTAEGRITVYAVPDLSPLATFQPDRVRIGCLALQRDPLVRRESGAPDPSWLVAAGTTGGMIYICDTATGSIRSICRGSAYDVYAVAFHPDGMTLASAGRVDARLWNTATGDLLLTVPGLDFGVALAWSPDGRKLAIGRRYEFAASDSVVYEIEAERGLRSLRGLSTQVTRVLFSHGGTHFAALSHDWRVALWNLDSNRLERVFEAPEGELADNAALCFSPDDRELVFATSGAACSWSVETGDRIRQWPLPPGGVQRLENDPEGRLLSFQVERIGAERWRIGQVRDLSRSDYLTPLASIAGFESNVFTAAFAEQGRYLLVCGRGATTPTDCHGMAIVDLAHGREVLRANYPSVEAYDHIVVDPQRPIFMRSDPATRETTLLQIPDLSVVDRFPGVFDSYSAGAEWVAVIPPSSLGMVLQRPNQPASSLALGIDHWISFPAQFSADGRRLAWGTAGGTVFVADLDEVQQRLTRLGL